MKLQLGSSLKKVINLYDRGVFNIHVIIMDMEFEQLKDAPGMELVDMNTTTSREHVG